MSMQTQSNERILNTPQNLKDVYMKIHNMHGVHIHVHAHVALTLYRTLTRHLDKSSILFFFYLIAQLVVAR